MVDKNIWSFGFWVNGAGQYPDKTTNCVQKVQGRFPILWEQNQSNITYKQISYQERRIAENVITGQKLPTPLQTIHFYFWDANKCNKKGRALRRTKNQKN